MQWASKNLSQNTEKPPEKQNTARNLSARESV